MPVDRLRLLERRQVRGVWDDNQPGAGDRVAQLAGGRDRSSGRARQRARPPAAWRRAPRLRAGPATVRARLRRLDQDTRDRAFSTAGSHSRIPPTSYGGWHRRRGDGRWPPSPRHSRRRRGPAAGHPVGAGLTAAGALLDYAAKPIRPTPTPTSSGRNANFHGRTPCSSPGPTLSTISTGMISCGIAVDEPAGNADVPAPPRGRCRRCRPGVPLLLTTGVLAVAVSHPCKPR